MSFIIDNDNSTDTQGKALPRLIGPFLTRTLADQWALRNLRNGSWNVAPVQDPRSLRRE